MGKGKKGNNASNKFEAGVDFKCKLIGIADVPAARGDDICQEAIANLKAQALKNNKEKKEHKQKITVNITLRGIRLIDETTERIDHAHPIYRISFISHDKDDKRTFGYIVGTKEGYKLFAIKTAKEAELITKTLKELFQEVFTRHQVRKDSESKEEGGVECDDIKDEIKENGQIEVGDEVFETSKEQEDSQLMWDELNDQIQEMQTVGCIPHSDSFDMLSDPFVPQKSKEQKVDPFGDSFTSAELSPKNDFNPFDDARSNDKSGGEKVDFFALPRADNNKRNVDDLLSLEPVKDSPGNNSFSDDLCKLPSPPPISRQDSNQMPLMENDPFAELKKSVNELHQQNLQQKQLQQQLGYSPVHPMQMSHQGSLPINNPYVVKSSLSNPNPFMANPAFSKNHLAQPLSGVSPSVPSATNPFQPQVSLALKPSEPDMGWTVTNPVTTTVKEVKKPEVLFSDPFAFLDNQTGLKSSQPMMSTSTNANKEMLDLLG